MKIAKYSNKIGDKAEPVTPHFSLGKTDIFEPSPTGIEHNRLGTPTVKHDCLIRDIDWLHERIRLIQPLSQCRFPERKGSDTERETQKSYFNVTKCKKRKFHWGTIAQWVNPRI